MSGTKIPAFEKGITAISNVLNIIGMALLFVMMVMGAADVIGRYVFNRPITGTMERGEVLLAIIVFFGWGYTHINRGHVNVELFLKRFPPRAKAISNFVTTFLSLVFFGLIIWQAIVSSQLYAKGGRLIYVIHWPLAPFHYLVSVGAFVLCLVFIRDLVQYYIEMTRGS